MKPVQSKTLILNISVVKQEAENFIVSLTVKDPLEEIIEIPSKLPKRSPGFQNDLNKLTYGQFVQDIHSQKALFSIGRKLFRFLFPGTIGDYYYKAEKECRINQSELTINLGMDPQNCPELLDLPWEIIHDGESFVLLNQDIDFIRTPLKYGTNLPDDAPSKLSILVAISNPINLSQDESLNTESEVEIFLKSFKNIRNQSQFDIHFLDNVSLNSLKEHILEKQPQILHFIGHGTYDQIHDESFLLMEDDEGKAIKISASKVTEIVSSKRLRLIVLNACETAVASISKTDTGLAWKLLQRKIPAIIAMRSVINDESAIQFTNVLYDSMAQGLSLSKSVRKARQSLAQDISKPHPAFAIPVLIQSSTKPIEFKIPSVSRKNKKIKPKEINIKRDREIHRILRIAKSKGIRTVFLLGPKKIGKTTLAKMAIQTLLARKVFKSNLCLTTSFNYWEEDLQSSLRNKHHPTIIHLELNNKGSSSALSFASLSKHIEPDDFVLIEGLFKPPFPKNSASIVVSEFTLPKSIEFVSQLSANINFEHCMNLLGYVGGNPGLIKKLLETTHTDNKLNYHHVKNHLDEILLDLGITRRFTGLPPSYRTILCLLGLSHLPVHRNTAEILFPKLMPKVKVKLSQLFDELIGEGWLISNSADNDQFILVPKSYQELIISVFKPHKIKELHSVLANYFYSISKSSRTIDIYEEAAFHYARADQLQMSMGMHMSMLDDLRNISPNRALMKCKELLDNLSVLEDEWLKLLMRVQVECIKGHCYKSLGMYDKSIECYSLVVKTVKENKLTNPTTKGIILQIETLMADSLTDLAELDLQNNRLDKVSDYLEEAILIHSKRGDLKAIAACHLQLAIWAKFNKDNNKFHQEIDLSLKVAKEAGNLIVLADTQRELGMHLFYEDKNTNKAIKVMEKALENANASGVQNSIANIYLSFGTILSETEIHATRSVILIEKAHKIYRDRADANGIANCNSRLAMLHLKFGELAEASKRFLQAHAYYFKAMRNASVEKCEKALTSLLPKLNRIGEVFIKESKFELATNFFLSAISVGELLEAKEDIDFAQFQLGIIAQEQRQFDESLEIFKTSRENGLAHSNWWVATESLHELGATFLYLRNLSEARRYLEQCIEEKKVHRKPESIPSTLHVLAILYELEGNLDTAYDLLNECVNQERTFKNLRGQAESMIQLASVALKIAKLDEARSISLESLKLCEKMHINNGKVQNLYILGEVSALEGDNEKAKELWAKSIHIAREIDSPMLPTIEQRLETIK